MTRHVFSLILVALFQVTLYSQFEITKIDRDFGLMSDKVNGVWQDEDGYIWVADEIGFNRINGNKVVNFLPDSSKLRSSNIVFDGKSFTAKKNTSSVTFDKKNYFVSKETSHIGVKYLYNPNYIIDDDTIIDDMMLWTHIGNLDILELSLIHDFSYQAEKSKKIIVYNQKDSILLNNEMIKTVNPIDYRGIGVKNHEYRFSNMNHPILGDPKNLYFRLKEGGFLMVTPDLETKKLPIENKFVGQILEDDKGGFYVISFDKKFIEYYSNDWKLISEITTSQMDDNSKLFNQNGRTYLINDITLFEVSNGQIVKTYDANLERVQRNSFDFIQVLGDTLFYVKNKYESGDFSSKILMNVNGNEYSLYKSKKNYEQILPLLIDHEKNIWINTVRGDLIKVSISNEHQINNSVTFNQTSIQSREVIGNTYVVSHLNPSLIKVGEDKIDLEKKHEDKYTPRIISIEKGRYYLECRKNELNSLYEYIVSENKWSLLDQTPDGWFYSVRKNLVINKKNNKIARISNRSLSYLNFSKEYEAFYTFRKIDTSSLVTVNTSLGSDIIQINQDGEIKNIKSYPLERDSISRTSLHIDNAVLFFEKNKLEVLHPNFQIDHIFGVPHFDSLPEYISDFMLEKYLYKDNKILQLGYGKSLIIYDLKTGESKKYILINQNKERVFVDYINFKSSDEIYIISENKVFSIDQIDEHNSLIQLKKIIGLPNKISSLSKIKKIDDFYIVTDNSIGFSKSLNTGFKPLFNSLNARFSSVRLYSQSKDFLFADSNLTGNLDLSYKENNLTISMETITHFKPESVYFSYQLKGPSGSEKWIHSDIDSIQLSNLSPGKYTFSFKSLNGYGIESEINEYKFTIHPPWWQSWWFRVISLIVVFLLFITIYKVRTRQLRKRKYELEQTVEERTKEVIEQKNEAERQQHLVEEKNKEILDSINYAKRIQNAILPPPKLVKEYIPDSFILYKPKDVVAGDFYWMEQKESMILFAAADCTGHGVPGAMVSVICNNGLNRSVREYGLTDPGKILDKTRDVVISEFEKSEEEVKDGMDISLCALDFKNKTLAWAGANNPLWIIRNGEILETKSNKQPIGVVDNPQPFTTHKIELQKGDIIYVFTDGFQDQFGGERGKKFKPANFKKLLLSICSEPMGKQLEIIDKTFEDWKGELEQLDDVCVIGVRL